MHRSKQPLVHHQIDGKPRRSPFLCTLGRDRLPDEAARRMIDAAAGVHVLILRMCWRLRSHARPTERSYKSCMDKAPNGALGFACEAYIRGFQDGMGAGSVVPFSRARSIGVDRVVGASCSHGQRRLMAMSSDSLAARR
jgi:hypothetical protein